MWQKKLPCYNTDLCFMPSMSNGDIIVDHKRVSRKYIKGMHEPCLKLSQLTGDWILLTLGTEGSLDGLGWVVLACESTIGSYWRSLL